MSHYGSSKAAINLLTKAWAAEYGAPRRMSEMGLSSESTAKALCGMTFLRFAMSISEPASFRLYVSNGYNEPRRVSASLRWPRHAV